jgi:hypothetical protein
MRTCQNVFSSNLISVAVTAWLQISSAFHETKKKFDNDYQLDGTEGEVVMSILQRWNGMAEENHANTSHARQRLSAKLQLCDGSRDASEISQPASPGLHASTGFMAGHSNFGGKHTSQNSRLPPLLNDVSFI